MAVTATRELARRGLSLLKAKRLVEAALDRGVVAARMPDVEDRATFFKDLQKAGISVRFLSADPVDIRALRERMGLTREQFALLFNLPPDTVDKWETGDRQPDAGSMAYLRVIQKQPDIAMDAQEV